MPLIVPCVPTGMNAGVSKCPCRVCGRPRRARVAVSWRINVYESGGDELMVRADHYKNDRASRLVPATGGTVGKRREGTANGITLPALVARSTITAAGG